jgi:hypothetical protein
MVEVLANNFKFSVEINNRKLTLDGNGTIVPDDVVAFCITALRAMCFDEEEIKRAIKTAADGE